MEPRSAKRLHALAMCVLIASSTAGAGGAPDVPVDLSRCANANLRAHFRGLKTGRVIVDGIPFQVSDKRVRVTPGKTQAIDLPGGTCAGLHVLHYLESPGASTEIGSYVMRFADGRRVAVPVLCGQNVHDWWKPQRLGFATMAHRDVFVYKERKQHVAFWRASIRNPRPRVAVSSLEIVNSHPRASINLAAVTLSDQLPPLVGGTPVFDPTAGEEQRLIATLLMEGSPSGKGHACLRLKTIGTTECIPALAPPTQGRGPVPRGAVHSRIHAVPGSGCGSARSARQHVGPHEGGRHPVARPAAGPGIRAPLDPGPARC